MMKTIGQSAFLRLLVLAFGIATAPLAARAAEPVPTVATFSILADMVRQIGGDRVEVTALVGPDGDPHVFRPTPRHAQALAGARLVFMNGLGFEGWMERLTDASGFQGETVVVSHGIDPLPAEEHHGHHQENNHRHGHGHKHGHHEHENEASDPHAWHDLDNAQRYAQNITEALIAADPAGEAEYRTRLAAYALAIAAVEEELQEQLAGLPPRPHRVVTVHDAFRYFEHAYGIEFLAPQGVSTEAEASARDVAHLIRQIRQEEIRAVFLENIADPRLIAQIQRETGAQVGGTLYSGALSGPDGPAPTYIDMMRHNIRTLMVALKGG